MDGLWGWLLISSAVLATAALILLQRQRRAFFSAMRPRSRAGWRNTRWVSPAWRTIARALVAAARPRARPRHAVHHILEVMSVPATPVRPFQSGAEPAGAPVAPPEDRPPQPTATVASASQEGTPDDAGDVAAAGAMSASEPRMHRAPDLAGARTADANVGIVYVDLAGRFTFATESARDLLAWHSGELALGDVLEGGSGQCSALLDLVARQEVADQPLALLAGGRRQQFEISALALRDRNGNMGGAALFLRRRDDGSSPLPGSR